MTSELGSSSSSAEKFADLSCRLLLNGADLELRSEACRDWHQRSSTPGMEGVLLDFIGLNINIWIYLLQPHKVGHILEV